MIQADTGPRWTVGKMISYDPEADAAYIDLGASAARDVHHNLVCPVAGPGEVIMDWKDGRLVGIEILGASQVLDPKVLKASQAS